MYSVPSELVFVSPNCHTVCPKDLESCQKHFLASSSRDEGAGWRSSSRIRICRRIYKSSDLGRYHPTEPLEGRPHWNEVETRGHIHWISWRGGSQEQTVWWGKSGKGGVGYTLVALSRVLHLAIYPCQLSPEVNEELPSGHWNHKRSLGPPRGIVYATRQSKGLACFLASRLAVWSIIRELIQIGRQ